MRGFGVQVEAAVQFDAFQGGVKCRNSQFKEYLSIRRFKEKKNLDPLYKCIKEIQGIKK